MAESDGGAAPKPRPKLMKRYYTEFEIVPIEEDTTHEFKAHMNLSEDEVPPWAVDPDNNNRKTRAAISKTLNAFINTGKGGTVYLGITDNGEVKGLNMTQYKMDHIMVNMQDLMERYKPPVEKHRWKLIWVPVVSKTAVPAEIQMALQYDPMKDIDKQIRQKPHKLHQRQYCWCDNDLQARYNTQNVIPMQYICEITIKPFDREDIRNKNASGKLKIHPIHQDERGRTFMRKQASVVEYSNTEIVDITRQQVKDHYQPELEKLRADILRMRTELVSRVDLSLSDD